MRKLILVFLVTWMSAFAAAVPNSSHKTATLNFNTPVRVLLAKGLSTVDVGSLGSEIYLFTEGSRQWKHLGKSSHITLKKVGRKTTFIVNNQPQPGSLIYLRGRTAAEPLRFQADIFLGALKLIASSEGVMVVNLISIENYLTGTVSAEMSPSWELEALKAQAVASRSYALYMMTHPRNPHYDLERTIQDQAYSGVEAATQRVRQAVSETLGEYLTEGNGPAKTYYHSRCGGRTEVAESVWGKPKSSLSGVTCPYCQRHPYLWKAAIKISEIASALDLRKSFLSALKITPAQKMSSGRVSAIKLSGAGMDKVLSSDQFRSRFGYTRVKSAFFNWHVERDTVLLEGTGAGHGVGMCQFGARYFAQQGKNYRQILSYYYPRLQLKH